MMTKYGLIPIYKIDVKLSVKLWFLKQHKQLIGAEGECEELQNTEKAGRSK